jgi:hypothetical protein
MPKIKLSQPKGYNQVIGSGTFTWKPGCISLVAEDRLPIGAVVSAQNMMQTQDGVWGTRWGSRNYGTAYTGPVTGAVEFSYNGTNYYGIIDNGVFKYAKDGGTWTTISGFTWNTSIWTNMLQYDNKILIANGVDAFSYIDLTTFTWVGYTHVAAPGAITTTLSSSLAAGTYAISYEITAVTSNGETLPSTVATVNVNVDRNAWYNPNATQVSTSSYYVGLSWTKLTATNIIGYNIYASDNISGTLFYLDSVVQPTSGTTVNYTDYGLAAINDFIQVPQTDTTTAPSFSWLAISDNRLYALGDPNHPWRLYFASATPPYLEGFSPYVGGGWVDIMPGGTQIPKYVGQFRDGKGDPMTTILTEEPSGYGSTWHCQITTSTIGNSVVSIPTLMQSLATFGTGAPRSVVQTEQNVYFHSGGVAGIYSTGSIPTLFNVLSTNEISLMIRTDLKAIPLSAQTNICATEFDRKLFISVPYGASQNNRIMVWDLEKQNWNPYAFDFGVQQFIRYTDNSGELHLLAIPTNPKAGNYLVELSPNYYDDNGAPFECHLQTGLIHVTPDHMSWSHIMYIFYEFGTPQGNITLGMSGTPLGSNPTLEQLFEKTLPFGTTEANVGFGTYAFSAEPFSFASVAPTVESEISVKKRRMINKIVNNWEADVTSYAVNTSWTLNQIYVTGQLVPVQPPSSWIVN